MSRIILKYQMYKKCFSTLPKPSATGVPQKQSNSATEKKIVQTKVDEEHIFGKKETVRKLQQLLGVSTFTALGIVNDNKSLSFLNGKTMTERFEILKTAGVTNDVISKYPSLLATDNLQENMKICREVTNDMNEVAPMLTLKINVLISMLKRGVSKNRLALLSEILQMPKVEICEALTKKPFLKTISIDKVETNLKLLLDNRVSIEDIHRDLWVLSYNTDIIQNRLDIAKNMRIEKIKTWMIRCQPEVLDRYATRRTDKKQILGDNSLAEYLSERLECSVDEAKVLMNKHPALQNKSMKKMNEILDFLFAQGFKPSQICRVPKILLHSVETTKQRLKELKPYGKYLDSLYLLTKSKKQYMQCFEALIKASSKGKCES